MPHGPPSKRPRRLDRDQIKADVLRGLLSGLPLSVIARRNEVSQQALDLWAKKDPAFVDELAASRALGWDNLAVECLTIIDDKDGDVAYDNEGVPHPNTANVLRDKARVETRLKLLAVWDSGRYGAAKTLRLEGEVKTTTRHVLDPRLLDDQGREALRRLLAQAQAQGLIEGPGPVDAEFEEVEALDPLEDVPDGG